MTKVKEKENKTAEIVSQNGGPQMSPQGFTKDDVTAIGQIFDLAKKACLDNDNLLVQVVSFKQQFINKLSSNVEENSK